MNNNNKDNVWIGIGINFFQNTTEYSNFQKVNNFLVDKFGSKYVFNPVTNQPHLNLYDIDVPRENLKSIEKELDIISKQFSVFVVNTKGVNYFPFFFQT